MCLWRKTESRSSSVCYHNGPLLQMKALISFVHVIIHNRGYDSLVFKKFCICGGKIFLQKLVFSFNKCIFCKSIQYFTNRIELWGYQPAKLISTPPTVISQFLKPV